MYPHCVQLGPLGQLVDKSTNFSRFRRTHLYIQTTDPMPAAFRATPETQNLINSCSEGVQRTDLRGKVVAGFDGASDASHRSLFMKKYWFVTPLRTRNVSKVNLTVSSKFDLLPSAAQIAVPV